MIVRCFKDKAIDMKVLMQSRINIFSHPRGDTFHMVNLAEHLKKMGVEVDISTSLEVDLDKYDIVHVFNLRRPQDIYLQVLNAKRNKKPLVLTPIYVSWEEFEKRASLGLRRVLAKNLSYGTVEYLKIFGRVVKSREFHKGVLRVLTKGYSILLKEIVESIDIFFPNSLSEMEKVSEDFNLSDPPFVLVFNGIDCSVFSFERVKIDEKIKRKIKDSVLCVSSISGNKNQLNLVKAMKGLPYKLFLIGDVSPNHRGYFKKILREMGDNVEYLGKVSHEELPQYYKAARVHVLPSWFETTGLVSLEAAAMKCNVVITDKGYQRDYFKDYAFYCKPDNVDSIRNAIVKAYNSPFNEEFRNYIIKNFTWEKAAEKTLEGYEKVLKKKNGK